MSTFRSVPDFALPARNGLRPWPVPEPVAEGLEVIRWAGGGGMGEVWQALQLAEQRVVALKVMRPLTGGESDCRRAEERFRREIAIAAQFENRALARVFGSGIAADGRLFYLMEWVEGEPLDAFLRSGPGSRATLESRVRLAEALCQGVAYLHDEGFLHRDLKPARLAPARASRIQPPTPGRARRVDASPLVSALRPSLELRPFRPRGHPHRRRPPRRGFFKQGGGRPPARSAL